MSNLRVSTLESLGSGDVFEIDKLGYTFEYAAGVTVSSNSQIIKDGGLLYRASGSTTLPYTTTGAGMPESGAFVEVDDVLRQDLADPDKGAALVARGVVAVDSTADLLALPESMRRSDLRYLVAGKAFKWDGVNFIDDTITNDATCAHIAKRLSDGISDDIACFGDSTMYGYLVGGATAETQDPDNPPAMLRKTLGHVYGYSGTVINAAVSGTDMFNLMRGTDVLPNATYEQRIAPGGIAASASVVYCNHGINDCQQSKSIEQFEKDWVDFVNITRKHGKIPVIVTCNPINPLDGGDPREATQIEMYDNAKRKVAQRMGVDLVDNYYYAKKSARRFTETVLIPDGIHPSSALYRQNGRNLALPLVSANVLSKEGDIASISGASYLDTQITNILRQNQTRTGLSFYGQRSEVETGLNVAVVLDEPFEYLSFMALQWDSGARMQVGVQGNTTPWGFPRCGKVYGAITNYKWDSDFVVKTDALAGLNVLYWVFDISDTRPINNAAALSGFAVPAQQARTGVVPPVITSTYRKEFSVLANQSISFQHDFALGAGSIVEFVDESNFVTIVMQLNASNEMIVTTRSFIGDVSSTVIATGEPAGSKLITLKITEDELAVSFMRIPEGVYVSNAIALTDSMPPVALSSHGTAFTIAPV